MFDDFVRDFRLLQKADSLIGKIWLNLMMRRFGLFAFAGLIAVFGLGMMNVAGLYALQASIGPVWAAVLIAIGDFVITAIVLLVARSSRPGSELQLAFDLRKTALDSIQADVRDLKVAMDAFCQELQETKDTIAGYINNPLDATVQRLLIPAATSLIRAFRSKKDKA